MGTDRKMTTHKHTPGPWTANGDTVKGPTGNIVAECCGYSVKATDPAQRAQGGREANAHLIAAAPELLAVVENLFAASDDNASASEIVNYINWQAARDALAKATGEEGAL